MSEQQTYSQDVIIGLEVCLNGSKPSDSRFEKLDLNLNKTVGGDDIWLYYLKGKQGNAITDICFITGKGTAIPHGYKKINVDLNSKAKGEYIYLCYTTDIKYPPILGLKALISDSPDIEPEPSDYDFIRINQDLNDGAGGKYIYLCYQPDYKSVPQNDLVFYVFGDTHLDASAKFDTPSARNEVISNEIKNYIKAKMEENERTFAVIVGDLMYNNDDMDDIRYLNIWGNRVCNEFGLTVCDGFGNHDVVTEFESNGYNGRYQVISREQAPFREKQLKRNFYYAIDVKQDIAGGKDHHFKQALYRWRYYLNGVTFHFIMLNLGMMRNSNDPKHCAARTEEFLDSTLERTHGDPIFIFQHYGFDANEVHGDDNWWPEKEQEKFIRKISGHNVKTIFHGHSHTFKKGKTSYRINGAEQEVPMNYCVGSANSDYKFPGRETYDWSIMKVTIKQHTDGKRATVVYEQIKGSLSKNKEPLVIMLETWDI